MLKSRKEITVLLIEDQEDDRFLFQRALRKAHPEAQLFSATDGVEAVDFFQKQGRFANGHTPPPADIMFLDLKMPGRNGFDVLRWMQEHSLLSTLKVVVLSGSSEPQDVALARKLGASDYLVKPISVEQLRAILDEIQA